MLNSVKGIKNPLIREEILLIDYLLEVLPGVNVPPAL